MTAPTTHVLPEPVASMSLPIGAIVLAGLARSRTQRAEERLARLGRSASVALDGGR